MSTPLHKASAAVPAAVPFLVAAAVFWLAFDHGAHGVTSRASLAITVWWLLLIVVGLGLHRLSGLSRPAVVAGALLAAFCTWTLASLLWSASAERTFAEFNRAALYVGIFALAALAGSRSLGTRWADGLGLGIAAVGVLSLASRFFPSGFPENQLATALPAAATRLSYPVGYWNGLAILVALSFPLLFRTAVGLERPIPQGLAVTPLPALAAAIFLTSSRTGALAAVIGTVVLLALGSERRCALAGAAAIAALGAAAAIGVLLARDDLVNGPLDSGAAASQGRSAAVLIALICVCTGLAHGLAGRSLRRLRPPRWGGRVVVGAAAVLVVVGIVVSDPAARFAEFKRPPDAASTGRPDFVQAHLLSGAGSGRWQFWGAAVDQFEESPVLGGSAGSYEAWWTQHGSLSMPVKDAHSLYLEALGELGTVGLGLILAAFAVGLTVGIRRALGPETNVTSAALTATFAAFAVSAALDWMWELTVVSVVGIACLGLVTAGDGAPRVMPAANGSEPRGRSRRRTAVVAAGFVAAWLLICTEAIPLLSDAKLRQSQSAAARGDLEAAREAALAARALEPWGSSPYLQLALVEEERGDVAEARRWIRKAIERDRDDWHVWLVAARLATKAGAIADARDDLARARALNPRSPLFASSP